MTHPHVMAVSLRPRDRGGDLTTGYARFSSRPPRGAHYELTTPSIKRTRSKSEGGEGAKGPPEGGSVPPRLTHLGDTVRDSNDLRTSTKVQSTTLIAKRGDQVNERRDLVYLLTRTVGPRDYFTDIVTKSRLSPDSKKRPGG